MKKLFTIIVLSIAFLAPIISQSQRNYFPVWTYHQKNVNIHGISIGIGTGRYKVRNVNTNGIKLELIGLGILMPMIPNSPIAQDIKEFNVLRNAPLSERINGMVISASGTACDCRVNGLTLGAMGQINYEVNGISIAGYMNFTQILNGFQFGLLFNETYKMNGLQLGFTNNSKEARGVQIGLINKSKHLRGIQIGLWNVNQDRSTPLINWSFHKDKRKERI